MTQSSTSADLRRIRHALEATVDAVVITTGSGNIVWVNSAFVALTGYAADEVIGENPRILQSGLHKPAFYRSMRDTIERGEVWKGDITNRRKDGSLYIEEMTITPVLGSDGAVEEFIAIKRDVSKQRRASDVLRSALRQAERTNRFQRELLANLSHEFHTPLAAIIGFSEVLALELGSHQREFAVNILHSGRRLLSTLDGLLELSSLQSGLLGYQPLWFNPRSLTPSTVDYYEPIARERGLTLKSTIDPDVPEQLWGDPILIERALHHVVDNAIGFTEAGSIEILTAIENGCLVVSVSDTGIGMAPEISEDVFRPFGRGPTERSGGGLGLGLAIVNRIAGLTGSQVRIESSPGEGSLVQLRSGQSVTSQVPPEPYLAA